MVLCTTFFSLQFQANLIVGEKNLPGFGSGSRFLAGSGFNEYGSETLLRGPEQNFYLLFFFLRSSLFANFYFFEQKKVRFLTKFFSKADNWIMSSFAKTITVADRKIARRLLLSLKPREVLRWKKILFKLHCLLGNRTRLYKSLPAGIIFASSSLNCRRNGLIPSGGD